LSCKIKMNKTKTNRILINNHWVAIGIILVVFYWFFESSIDAFLLDEGRFLDRVIRPGTKELFMRVFVISIIMIGAYLLNLSFIRNKVTEEAMILAKDYTKNLINSSLDMIIAMNLGGKIIEFNPAAETKYGYSKTEVLGQSIDMFYTDPSDSVKVINAVMHHGKFEGEIISKRKDGENFFSFIAASPLRDSNQSVVGIMGISRDITEHKQFEEKLQLQLERLKGLNSIEKAINASLDLNVTLDVMLSEITTQFKIDAASILLLNQYTQILEYIASRGFHSDALKFTRLKVGEGNAGRAALERCIVTMTNLDEDTDGFMHSKLFPKEDFKVYFGVPLIVKGKVKGVLELFHRTEFSPDPDWLEFLETIAGQAAIAIDNAGLFDSLQRSNVDLTLAYDETIEGWARALEFRDKETKGHSQRVTELTMEVARIMGINEAEQAHIYRGSLLHDIGKMGIPDNILLKPGKLNDEEWKIMRRHPVLGYELLSPINFLRSAVDIPYCHHEKWDGTGYPRGLKGDQIPLPARIFALVDIYDALISDRPYRPALPKEKVLSYIQSLSGSHLDPKVVKVFLKLKG
jgi:PAS domain S-box-containing protein